ncbi:hypothetical protein MTO96_040864 [Rhipicephalus appendiculatus]
MADWLEVSESTTTKAGEQKRHIGGVGDTLIGDSAPGTQVCYEPLSHARRAMIIEPTRPSKLSCLTGAKADRSERAASRETSRRLERPQRFYHLLSRTCWRSQQAALLGK